MSETLSPIRAMLRIRVDRKALNKDIEAAAKDAGRRAGDNLERGVADGVGDKSGRIRREQQRTNRRLEDEAEKAGRRAGDKYAGGLLGKLQKNSTKLTVGVTAPLVALGTMAYRTYAEAADLADATNVIFGESAQKIHDLAEAGAQTMALSKDQVYAIANRIGPVWNNLGLSAESAAEKTEFLIRRSADMASLFTGTADEAAAAIASGLAGESEPLKKYGVGLSEAAVAAYAISEGLVQAEVDTVKLEQAQVRVEKAARKVAEARKSGTDLEAREASADLAAAEQNLANVLEGKIPVMDDATIALARLGLLTEQTDVAMGNFAATADSDANKLKILAAEAQNAEITFGEALAPALETVTEKLTDILVAYNNLPDWAQMGVLIGVAVVAATGPLLRLIALWDRVTGAAGRATTAQVTAAGAGQGAGAAGAGGMLLRRGGTARVGTLGTVGAVVAAGYAGYQGGKWIGEHGAGDWLADQGWFSAGATKLGGWLGDLDSQGVVTATPGGSLARLAEAGTSEVVAHVDGPRSPFTRLHERLDRLEQSAGGAPTIIIQGDVIDPERTGRELERAWTRARTRTYNRQGALLP